MPDYEVYYIPHQFTGQPVPCRRPVRREVRTVGVSPLEGTLRQLEAACKLWGTLIHDKSPEATAEKAKINQEIKDLHDQAIAEAAEALL